MITNNMQQIQGHTSAIRFGEEKNLKYVYCKETYDVCSFVYSPETILQHFDSLQSIRSDSEMPPKDKGQVPIKLGPRADTGWHEVTAL